MYMSTVPMMDCGKLRSDKLVIVIDMQKDFVTGSLGSPLAQKIVPSLIEHLEEVDCPILFTMDTHDKNYLDGPEGKYLPVKHCIKGTEGHLLIDELIPFAQRKSSVLIEKPTFGSVQLAESIATNKNIKEVELMGVCTDICVVSNALLLRAFRPDLVIKVNPRLCAATSEKNQESALDILRSCQIEVL